MPLITTGEHETRIASNPRWTTFGDSGQEKGRGRVRIRTRVVRAASARMTSARATSRASAARVSPPNRMKKKAKVARISAAAASSSRVGPATAHAARVPPLHSKSSFRGSLFPVVR